MSLGLNPYIMVHNLWRGKCRTLRENQKSYKSQIVSPVCVAEILVIVRIGIREFA